MLKPKCNTRWNYPQVNARSSGKSLTHQEFKDDADINNIIARYMTTGQLGDPNATRQPIFGDFTQIPTLQESYNLFVEAQNAFDNLPIDLRRKFNFNPQELLSFLSDEKNRDEAIKYGLVQAPPPVEDKTPPDGAPSND